MIYEYRNYCEIDLNAIASNLKETKKLVDKDVKILGVVKADAYGHGALEVSRVLAQNGIEYLAVATLEEALQIRSQISTPILILGYIGNSDSISVAIENNISMTVYNIRVATEINNIAERMKKKAIVHIKIDTGMTRLGFLYSEYESILRIKEMNGLFVEGIFTHFSSADSDEEYTYKQFKRFINICDRLENSFDFKYKHCCNSAATLNFPDMHLDMVRVGIMLYGLKPYENIAKNKVNLTPAMSLKSKIVDIKKVKSNTKVSYGGSYITKNERIIAVLPIGYADGFSRMLSDKFKALIKGEYADGVGKVCMDHCMIDVTDIPDVNLYDEVILIGTQDQKNISVDQIASSINTINYEIVCSFSKRVPRVYNI